MDIDEFLSIQSYPESGLRQEDFKSIGRVHDWRNYVPDAFISTWQDLSDRERAIIYLMAQDQSNAEEWE